MSERLRIYWCQDDADLDDGLGWNVVDADSDSGIAARFATWEEACTFAEEMAA